MKLILTRHGETEENKQLITQGHLPGHLSDKGKEQAVVLAAKLRGVHIDVIYTSDLKRCVDTTNEIVKYHKDSKFIKEKLIRERNWGVFQGKNRIERDRFESSTDNPEDKPKDGESAIDVWNRLKKFYDYLLDNYNDETILVVSHGFALRLFHGIVQKKDIKESLEIPLQGNAAISEFEIDKEGNCKVVSINS